MTRQKRQLDVGNSKDLAKYRLELAKGALLDAECCHTLNGKNNRLYYAIFYAVSAILDIDGVGGYSSHGQTIGNFNRIYVHEKRIFPVEYAHKIAEAQSTRNASDYGGFYLFSKEETESLTSFAHEFIKAADEYCKCMSIETQKSKEESDLEVEDEDEYQR